MGRQKRGNEEERRAQEAGPQIFAFSVLFHCAALHVKNIIHPVQCQCVCECVCVSVCVCMCVCDRPILAFVGLPHNFISFVMVGYVGDFSSRWIQRLFMRGPGPLFRLFIKLSPVSIFRRLDTKIQEGG